METYTVPKYDPKTMAGTLSGIAREKGVTLDELLNANPQYKQNPALVREGAVLQIPTKIAPIDPAAPASPVAPASNVAPGADKPLAEGVRGSTFNYGAPPGATPVAPTPVTPPTPATPATPGTPGYTPTPAGTEAAKAAGAAGIGIDDFTKYFSSVGLSPEETAKIKADLGLTDLEAKAFTPPSKTTDQLYNDAYVAAGLSDIKKKIADIDAKVAEKEQQLNERLLKIDENPWLSEASRAKSVTREKDFFERTISTYTDQKKAYQDTYNAGVTEIGNLVTRQSNDFTTSYNVNQAKLTYLQKKAESQIATAQAARVSAYLPEYLKAKAAATKPDTIGSAEGGFYRWDPTKGQFVQVTPGTGKAKTEAQSLQEDTVDMAAQLDKVRGGDGYISPDNYNKAKQMWTSKAGRSAKSFDEAFAGYRNPSTTNYNVTY